MAVFSPDYQITKFRQDRWIKIRKRLLAMTRQKLNKVLIGESTISSQRGDSDTSPRTRASQTSAGHERARLYTSCHQARAGVWILRCASRGSAQVRTPPSRCCFLDS